MYLDKCAKETIEKTKKPNDDLIQLSKWFGINIKWVEEKIWFTQQQLNKMVEGEYEEADYLREIAILLKEKGDESNAYKLISRALELRPNGPYIVKLKKEMDKMI